MLGNKKVVCVIPARLGSTRFPRKMLALLKGKPLVQWAYEGALECTVFDEVVVAVDSEELMDAIHDFGGKAILTAASCQSGTERLVELATTHALDGDIWVNWQGDEPFVSPSVIDDLLQSCSSSDEEVWTLKHRIGTAEEIQSPHVVKVVCDREGKALYFSRSCIPHGASEVFKHVGIYAYTKEALRKISTLSPSPLEQLERLEQLRFLYHGMQIRVHETSEEIFGIDTKEELLVAEQIPIC